MWFHFCPTEIVLLVDILFIQQNAGFITHFLSKTKKIGDNLRYDPFITKRLEQIVITHGFDHIYSNLRQKKNSGESNECQYK